MDKHLEKSGLEYFILYGGIKYKVRKVFYSKKLEIYERKEGDWNCIISTPNEKIDDEIMIMSKEEIAEECTKQMKKFNFITDDTNVKML